MTMKLILCVVCRSVKRAGVLRYFTRIDERIYWSDSREGVLDFVPEAYRAQYRLEMVKSFTFIPGSLADNVELMEKDPGYEGNLMAQDRKHAIRLLKGCWYDVGGENDLFSLDVLEDAFPIVLLQKGSGISLLMWRWMVVMFFGWGLVGSSAFESI